jgi:PGF-CTERM protein/uncharacterized repeat protein (TIGR01451 family)
MEGKIVKWFAFGFVLVLLMIGILAGVPATAQAKSEQGLVAEWHFDEGSGSVVKDSSGNGNDGTIHGATWVDGKYGKALEFYGVGDYATSPDSEDWDFGTEDFTIETWIYLDSFSSSSFIPIICWGEGASASFPLYMNWAIILNDNKLSFYRYDGTETYKSVAWTPSTNTWYHIAAVRSGNALKFFVDGSQQGTDQDVTGVSYGEVNADPLYISRFRRGDGSTYDYLHGIIDEVRIYNRALSAEGIKAHCEGKQPDLVLTKSASPSTIQEGETTTISIRVENTGTGDATSVEVTDTIPTGFKIISGSKSTSFDEIKPGVYRTYEYTLKATGSEKFTCEPATATYKDADGNSYSAASNSVSIQVGGEVPVGADSDGDGWSDEKEREMGTNPYSVDSDGDGLKDAEDPNPTVPEEKKTPGFEAVFTVVGLLAVVYVLRRRR